tara:strand:+ start:246 stop:494 length:249 start_codon:yes stop_codon:yes gene_type:complete
MTRLLLETIGAGILIVVIGTVVSFIVGKVSAVDLPPTCKEWNKNYVMEISLFFTGVTAHLLAEYFGLNRWYCSHGVACTRHN